VRSRATALAVLLLPLAACSSHLEAEPLEIAPAAVAAMARAQQERERAAGLADEERARAMEAALAAAREAVAAAPDELRARLLVQDLELEIDERGARDRYAHGPAATAVEKVLAARALLPDRTAEARALLQAAIEQDGDLAWARYGLAFVERKNGRSDRARALCEEALARDPMLIEALRMVADLYQDGGDRVRAIEARRLLLEVGDDDLAQRHALAQLLLEADDRSDAHEAIDELRSILDTLGEALEGDARDLARDCWVDLGTAYARRNNDVEAIGCWERALALDRDCLMALYNIGVVDLKRDKAAAALAAFEEYLARARASTKPLPVNQVFYRHYFVPNQVRDLRARLEREREAAKAAGVGGAP